MSEEEEITLFANHVIDPLPIPEVFKSRIAYITADLMEKFERRDSGKQGFKEKELHVASAILASRMVGYPIYLDDFDPEDVRYIRVKKNLRHLQKAYGRHIPRVLPSQLMERVIVDHGHVLDSTLITHASAKIRKLESSRWFKPQQHAPEHWVAAIIYEISKDLEGVKPLTKKYIMEIFGTTSPTIKEVTLKLIRGGVLDSELVEFDGEEEQVGYVYIITNENWEGWCKFGESKDPENAYRGKGRYVPHYTFRLEHKYQCKNWKKVEKAIKKSLSTNGYQPDEVGTEWYQISVEELHYIILENTSYQSNKVID